MLFRPTRALFVYTKNSEFTLTSGESSLAGTKTEVVALFADLRGFSSWCVTQPIENVAELIKIQLERVVQILNDHHHCFHKFLGDGFLLLWESDEEMDISICLQHALAAAFHIHWKYWFLRSESSYELPVGYGLGISVGEAIRIQPETFIKEMNEVDFLGYPLNCAARLQSLSDGFGTTVCSETARRMLDNPSEYLISNRKLIEPFILALKRAEDMKGLKDIDRTEFRHLIFRNSVFDKNNPRGQ